MTTISSIPDQSSVHSGSLLRRAWAFNWPLTLTVLINLALVPIVLALFKASGMTTALLQKVHFMRL